MGMECGMHGSGEKYVQSFGRKLEERMRWAGNVARTGVERNTHKGSAEKLEDRMRWVGNVARKRMEKNTYREDLWRYVNRSTLRNHLHVMGFVITSHVGMRKNLVRRPTYHMSAMLHHTCAFLPWFG